MGMLVDNLYSDRKGFSEELASDVLNDSVITRVFRLMETYSGYKEKIYGKYIDCISSFLESVYFNLKDDTPEESRITKGFNHYKRFASQTTISKFFDTLEIYCIWLRRSGNPKLEYFIDDFNKLLMRNGIPYKLIIDPQENIVITKLSESQFIQEKIETFVRLTAENEFEKCQNIFIEAENCFAKRKFDEVLTKCNSTIETILCIILNKGSGTIKDLNKDFLKKYKLPRVYENYMPHFTGLLTCIQNARSQYARDIHGKNPEKDNDNVDDIIEELCEMVLSETASFGIFIIKTYNKTK